MLAAVVLWRSQTHPECSVSPVGRQREVPLNSNVFNSQEGHKFMRGLTVAFVRLPKISTAY